MKYLVYNVTYRKSLLYDLTHLVSMEGRNTLKEAPVLSSYEVSNNSIHGGDIYPPCNTYFAEKAPDDYNTLLTSGNIHP